jgi:hypothetical protein
MIFSIITPNLVVAVLKIIVVIKLFRMFDMDGFYMRKLGTKPNWKVMYVIAKQMITIFVLSHTVGLIFYVIDYALVNDPICQDNNSCNPVIIEYAGCIRQLPIRQSFLTIGRCDTSTRFIGESTLSQPSATVILRPITRMRSSTLFSSFASGSSSTATW